MKIKVILSTLLMVGLVNTGWAVVMCEEQKSGSSGGYNLKSAATLPDSDEGGGTYMIAGKAQRANNYGTHTSSGTECGNIYVFSTTTPSSTQPQDTNYYPKCEEYYEPNVYRDDSHACKAVKYGSGAAATPPSGTIMNYMQCGRDESKACRKPS